MRGENPLIFLFIFPIDKSRRMWYNRSFGRAPTTPGARYFYYNTASTICQEKNTKKIKQIIIPKFVHFDY